MAIFKFTGNSLLVASFMMLCIFSNCNNSVVTSQNLEKKLDEFLMLKNNNNQFDGTVVIAVKGNVILSKAYGIADRVWNIRMTEKTRFDIASLNKSFQAALILKCVEENQIQLQDRLVSYFPGLLFDSSITIHHLLTHTSGLPDYSAIDSALKANDYREFKRRYFTNLQYADFISRLEPMSEPGSQFYYSNFNYHLLALLLESVHRKPFEQILEDEICQPFGLSHTFSESDNRAIHDSVAEAYSYSELDSDYLRNNFIDLSIGRRIFSTSEDLYKWNQILMNGDFISEGSYDLMTTNHLSGIEDNLSYGYGFLVFDGGNYRMGNLGIKEKYVIHGGSTEGYKSILVNINRGELVITFLSNIGDRTDELNLAEEIAKMILAEN